MVYRSVVNTRIKRGNTKFKFIRNAIGQCYHTYTNILIYN